MTQLHVTEKNEGNSTSDSKSHILISPKHYWSWINLGGRFVEFKHPKSLSVSRNQLQNRPPSSFAEGYGGHGNQRFQVTAP
jgi:hypothetical protein